MATTGSDWTSTEIAAVVADYLEMFADELAGRPYNKREHNRGLQAVTGRSAGSIEFKYQNISAVLAELGMPWLRGYKPRSNYQEALVAEIASRLDRLPKITENLESPPSPATAAEVFVPPPGRRLGPASPALDSLIRTFDPAARDAHNRALGRAGEAFVLEVEERRLHSAGRPDLMRKVAWVSRDEGDGAGYDIRSFDPSTGLRTLIEVKTTRGARTTPFYLTRNEEAVSRDERESWLLYRVFEFGGSARIFKLKPPLDEVVKLVPATWAASF